MHRHRRLGAATLAVLGTLVAASPAVADSYPPIARSSFVHQCVARGGAERGCVCAINYIQAHESLGAFEIQSLRYAQGGPVPTVVKRAVASCGLGYI